ncbi:MAG: AMP-binding protein, partial [Terriglobia bacterium]
MSESHPVTDYLAEFARHGAGTAFVTRRGYRNERVSYLEIAEAASQFGHELAARKIGKGERVVLWGGNSAEWVMAFLGSIQRGAVPVPLDAFVTPDVAASVIRDVSPALLVCSSRFARLSGGPITVNEKPVASHLTADPPNAAGSLHGGNVILGVPVIELERLREAISRHPRTRQSVPALWPSDPLEIIFTSGATSEPRGVVITHGNIQSNLAPFEPEIQKYLKYERFFHPIGFLNLVPLSHVFGQFMGIFVPPLLGGTVHFLGPLNLSEILHTIRHERISVLVTVPRLVESLRNKIERDVEAAGPVPKFRESFEAASSEPFFRRWWRFRRLHLRLGWKFWALVCGGAALDRETETFWSRLGFVVAQGYGLTETASLISVNHPFDPHQGSIGKVMPGQEIKLDEHGEILVRGQNIAAAYWRRNQLEPVLGQDGWFHTGDVGEIDSNGQLYFKGRRKRVIVTPEGMNVFPEDLEAALRRQPEVKECVVAGLDREGNSVPCAALILRGAGADPAAAVKRANLRLAPYQQIRHWILWPDEDFPRTATLKPRLGEIEARVRSEAGSPDGCLDPSEGAGASAGSQRASPIIVALIERVTGRKVSASRDAGLATDLNLSSVDRMEILSAIEDRYQVELDDAQFTAATTLADLERLIQAGASESEVSNADAGTIPAESSHTESGLPVSNILDTGKSPAGVTFPRWTQTWPVNGFRALLYYLLVWPATMLLGKPRITGREHLRGLQGPVLVVANHVFMIDVGYVLAALPWRFRHRLTVAMDGELIESFHRPPARFG